MADRVKLITAAFICLVAFGGFAFLLSLLPPQPNWVYPVLFVPFALIVLGFVTAKFNARPELADADVRRLEAAGLIESTDYRATRAFEVKEFEDEGPHYFLELDDGRVLYLSGQYLYEYEPRTGKSPKPRQFPCTDFIVRRHRIELYGIEVICRGVRVSSIPRSFCRSVDCGRVPGACSGWTARSSKRPTSRSKLSGAGQRTNRNSDDRKTILPMVCGQPRQAAP